MTKLTLYTDGGSRNNPGPAGIGGVAFDQTGNEIFRFKKFLGNKTNNQAEYLGLVEGLNLARAQGATEVDVYMDSELVIKQMKGEYKIKHEDLKPLALQTKGLIKDFQTVTFTAVRREKNKIADKLVNEAIDEGTGLA